MDNDDRPVGRILSRREVLALFGAAGITALVGCAPPAKNNASSVAASTSSPATEPTTAAARLPTSEPTLAATEVATAEVASLPACVVSPAMTEGPYFVDERLNRSDIRANTSDGTVKEGTPLELTLRAFRVNGGCTPLAGAMVDIWHCDALGIYSDVTDRSFNTVGQDFLRGYQMTDANGVARFTTIYPGWYPGRAVHIHFKVRGTNAAGQNYEFTSQFFFDDALSEQVFSQGIYAQKGTGFLRNAQDNIYRSGNGDRTTLTLTSTSSGYAGTFDIGIQI